MHMLYMHMYMCVYTLPNGAKCPHRRGFRAFISRFHVFLNTTNVFPVFLNTTQEVACQLPSRAVFSLNTPQVGASHTL